MTPSLLHPREQIAHVMSRIYTEGMTTTSGGNVSVRDGDDLWISPSGVDKGSLTPQDVVRVGADGTVEGLHAPSSEHPFHRAIYRRRPDLHAIVHAHPPGLVAFSIVRQIPETRIVPQARYLCGSVGYAPYELPGSEALGALIAEEFEEGHNAVIMENHGTVVGGSTLPRAFERFETLEFCARTIINARTLGGVRHLDDVQIRRFEHADNELPEMETVEHPADERGIRSDICRYVRRACRQQLMISTYGTVSIRWRGDDFVITPTGLNRRHVCPEDLVQIRDGRREPGEMPSRSVRLHQQIYRAHPHVNSIILTQAPHAMAFAVSEHPFDTRTIPESYILLKDVPVVPYGRQFDGASDIPDLLSPETPIALVQNDCLLVTGDSILETFDRLEVAEFSARSLIQSVALGEMVPIAAHEIEDLKRKFLS